MSRFAAIVDALTGILHDQARPCWRENLAFGGEGSSARERLDEHMCFGLLAGGKMFHAQLRSAEREEEHVRCFRMRHEQALSRRERLLNGTSNWGRAWLCNKRGRASTMKVEKELCGHERRQGSKKVQAIGPYRRRCEGCTGTLVCSGAIFREEDLLQEAEWQ
jgi:hypothetical protein